MSWTTDRTFTHRFDVGPATEDAKRVGIHYDLRYEFSRTRTTPDGHHYGLALAVTGFEDMKRDADALSTVHFEAAVTGRYYGSAVSAPLEPELQKRQLELLDLDPEQRTPEQTRELDGLIARVRDGRRFLSYDVHHRFEYGRLSDSRQHAFGVGVSGEVPYLHSFLGLLSEITGTRPGFQQKPVRAYVGFDYVLAEDQVVADTPVADNYPRLRGQLAWSTLILDQFVLRATWHADYIISAPAPIRDVGREFNNVLQAWFVFPLQEGAGLMVKYTAGHFAPDYRQSDELKLGLTASLR